MLIALTHLGFRANGLAEPAAPCFHSGVFDASRLHARGEVQVVGIAGDEIPVHNPQGVDLVP